MKIKILAALLILCVMAACAIAENTDMVTTESVFYIKAIHTFPKDAFSNIDLYGRSKSGNFNSQLSSFLKTCKPFNENVNINFLGLDATLNIKGNGFTNKKCTYDLSAKLNSIPTGLLSEADNKYNSNIIGIEPKVRCELSKEQVEKVIDEFDEAYNQYVSDKMGKSSKVAKRNFEKKISQDKVFNELVNEHVCKIINEDEILQHWGQSVEPYAVSKPEVL